MDVFTQFINCIVGVFVKFLNFFFGITVFGINFGALFVITIVIAFAAWLIWG